MRSDEQPNRLTDGEKTSPGWDKSTRAGLPNIYDAPVSSDRRRMLKGLPIGLLAGVAGTLLIQHFTDQESEAQRLADAMHCSHPVKEFPANVHHGLYGLPWWPLTHSDGIEYVGCDLGPGTRYMHFGLGIKTGHVVASLAGLPAVCVTAEAVFDSRMLNGREELEHLCDVVGGTVKVPPRRP